MTIWTIVVAAGRGERFGGDKQAADLGGRPVVAHSVATAMRASDGVVVVVAAERLDEAEVLLAEADGVLAVVDGGATRSDSVRSGLAAVPDDAEVILVHDGARPLASDALFARVVAAVKAGADAVVPGVPVADSLRAIDGSVVDRDGVIAVQTPQGFSAHRLRSAHAAGGDASDDATLVEAAGGTVVVVDGEVANLKITRPVDLALAATLKVGDDGANRGGAGV
ncbi:MAG: 2-C-methyl-D-erythritol 4-phosphate cytidylyltransferase [Actinomycetota bacterium]|nr:2-C-methyl-D-erythritol 4-phosphate cytidylyltransferase [Actinomycetota bacterium]MEC9395424.1 2-C-methyl-D-erythritol 4-phosphate cytidylyltransferase [Actinomycetota bacterium]